MENSRNYWETLRGNQQPSPPTSLKLWREGSETIMGTEHTKYECPDGIVHSIWKQMANIKEARDPGAIPGPATRLKFNMANITKKLLAQELRHRGWSIAEIAKELNMHKSGSISKWCRDIVLTPEQIERLTERQESGSYKGRVIATEKLRKDRLEEVELMRQEGLKEIGAMDERDLFIAGLGMYWSEGETYPGGDRLSFINSDPKMILFMLKWFRDICEVLDDRFSLQVKINEIHQNRTKEIENYWSDLTGIPLAQFTKTILIKAKLNKIYPNPNGYFGTLRITVRQGTKLRRKLNGWLEGLANLPV